MCVLFITILSVEAPKSDVSIKLQVLKIPAYFTEFCVKSYELTRLQIDVVNQQLNSAVTSVRVSEPILNPFRSPIRKHDLQTAVPAFSNAVIFHLEYWRRFLAQLAEFFV